MPQQPRIFQWILPSAMMLGSTAATAVEPPETPADVDWPQGFVNEAPLPEGFPPPSEVGKIVEKTYPAARTYWAKGTVNTAFWRCFSHLKQKKHEMTAPVVWEYDHRDPEEPKLLKLLSDPVTVERLHFILEDPTLDEVGEAGAVTVADMPKQRVLSIAYQGKLTAEAVHRCEKKLQEELEQRDDVKSAGQPRIFGYNSPMVKAEKRYWDIQLPIAELGK